MGRSVSYPAGAVVAFRELDDGDDDIDWAYERLADEVLDTAKSSFPSLNPLAVGGAARIASSCAMPTPIAA